MEFQKTQKPELSLVLPCYNEAQHIDKSIERIIQTLEDSRLTYEVILIDDKSKDDTAKHIKNIVKKNKNIRAFFHKENFGRGGTVKDGILKSRANIVGFIDIDLEVLPDYIPHILRVLKNGEADMVVGQRHYPFHFFPIDHLLRLILSNGYTFMVRNLLYLPIHDTESGYKFFIKKKIIPVLTKTQDMHWFWDTEITARALMDGLRVKEVPVLFLRNEEKTSTVKLIPDTIDYFKAIIKFKRSLMTKGLLSKNIGWLYKFPPIYTLAIRALYGKHYITSYKKIASLIPENSSLVDVCCGDAILYSFLKSKNIDYLGLDANQPFINSSLKRKIRIKLGDARYDEIPEADYIVLQRSLYQFKNPVALVNKLRQSARKGVIISESINNLENSFFGKMTSKIIPLFVGTNFDNPGFRFNEKGFKKILNPFSPKYMKVEGGRDLMAVIKKR